MAVDEDIGDGRVLEQRLERPEAEELVEHVADQLLALGVIERVILLAQLLRNDVANLGFDLLTRHLVERREVDEIEQPLMKLDLELGMLVTLGEGSGIADRHEPVLFELLRAGLLVDGLALLWLADLPHHLRSRPSAAARPSSIVSRSFAVALLRFTSLIGIP